MFDEKQKGKKNLLDESIFLRAIYIAKPSAGITWFYVHGDAIMVIHNRQILF